MTTETLERQEWEGAQLSTYHDDETHEHIIVVSRPLPSGHIEYLVAANWWLVADADEDPRAYCVAKLPCYVYNSLLSVAEAELVVRIGNDLNSYIHQLLGFPPEESFDGEPF